MRKPPIADRITQTLERLSTRWLSVYAIVMAFTAYFCMYSFRKPFSVGLYSGAEIWGAELKNVLVIAQLCGYACSKFIGIRFNSELKHSHRLTALILLVVWAEIALVLFALAPDSLKVFAIFLNGLPLGAVWGVVFSFLEGRRTSELLGAGLSCSYIVASGFVKSAGKGLLEHGISESWMPAATGAMFLPVFLVAAVGLSLLPAPSAEDERLRTQRRPMKRVDRKTFVSQYLPGIVLLVIVYVFLTAYRDFRDNYAAEIWVELGLGSQVAIFTATELPIALAVMFALAMLYFIRDNQRALTACYAVMMLGCVLIGLSTVLFEVGVLSGTIWMILVGLGLYMAYVPYGCVLFDRKIATLQRAATAVFLIYISDAMAYAGAVVAILYKQFAEPDMSFLSFFRSFSYVTAVVTTIFLAASWVYFARAARRTSQSICSAP